MSTTQGIKLDEVTAKRLKVLAGQRNRSAHWLMRDAIERYLQAEERYEREKAEDMAEYEEYVLTGSAVQNATAQAWLAKLADGKKTAWPKQQ